MGNSDACCAHTDSDTIREIRRLTRYYSRVALLHAAHIVCHIRISLRLTMNSETKSAAVKKSQKGFGNPEVAAVYRAYPKDLRTKLMLLRRLIFDTASATEGVGELEETLKWGQPSYLTTESKSGSTVRIDRVKSDHGQYAMYFNCQTTLIETFRELYPNELKYGGNRSIIFNENDEIPEEELQHCISSALTYHLRKGRSYL